MPRPQSSATIEQRSEALVRLLRTVLDEARALIDDAPIGEQTAALRETIARLQREAASLAPDYPTKSVRNGAAKG